MQDLITDLQLSTCYSHEPNHRLEPKNHQAGHSL